MCYYYDLDLSLLGLDSACNHTYLLLYIFPGSSDQFKSNNSAGTFNLEKNRSVTRSASSQGSHQIDSQIQNFRSL